MRELRDALERSQQESLTLRRKVDELSTEVETLKGQLAHSREEQERLARMMLQKLNPTGQKSAFSVADVAELVAYLKKP